ncbi:MAG: hypothetical protein U0N17_08910, partial [Agathobaculum butyriciproducens]
MTNLDIKTSKNLLRLQPRLQSKGHTELCSDMAKAAKSSSFVETFLRTCIKRVIHAPPFYEFPAEILLNAHLAVRNACISFLLSPAY